MEIGGVNMTLFYSPHPPSARYLLVCNADMAYLAVLIPLSETQLDLLLSNQSYAFLPVTNNEY